MKCKQCNKVPIIFITSDLTKKHICFCRFAEVEKVEKIKLDNPAETLKIQFEGIKDKMEKLDAKIKKDIKTNKFSEVPQLYETYDILREIYYA